MESLHGIGALVPSLDPVVSGSAEADGALASPSAALIARESGSVIKEELWITVGKKRRDVRTGLARQTDHLAQPSQSACPSHPHLDFRQLLSAKRRRGERQRLKLASGEMSGSGSECDSPQQLSPRGRSPPASFHPSPRREGVTYVWALMAGPAGGSASQEVAGSQEKAAGAKVLAPAPEQSGGAPSKIPVPASQQGGAGAGDGGRRISAGAT